MFVDELVQMLEEIFVPYTQVPVQRDVVLPEMDVPATMFMAFPMGWCIAHHVLDRPTSPHILQKRRMSLLRNGIDMTWWVTDRADTPLTRAWLYAVYQVCYRLIVIDNCIQPERWIYHKVGQTHGTEMLAQRNVEQGRAQLVAEWRYQALVRYFELWGAMTGARLHRALAGRSTGSGPSPIEQWGNGMIGLLNKQGLLSHTQNNGWCPVQLSAIYPSVPRLPPEGIIAARERARSYIPLRMSP